VDSVRLSAPTAPMEELTPGYKWTEVGVIPEDWLVASLGEIGKFKNGINMPKENFGHGFPFVNLMDVFGVPKVSPETSTFGLINSTPTERKLYDLQAGDVLFVRSSVKPTGVGLTALILETLPNTVFSGFLIRYRSRGELTPEFSEHCFWEENFRKRVIANSTVSANTNINQEVLKRLQIGFPPDCAEQRAISEVLSDVDRLLGALEVLIAKKKDIKQAAMQQLLTGRTRLPGFSGEWETTQVKNVITRYFCGPSPTCEERNIDGSEEWGVLKTTAATIENGWDWRKHKVLPRTFWGQDHLKVNARDVIITKAGPRHRVGIAVWVDHVPDRVIVSGKMIGLRLDLNRVVPLILAAALQARETQLFLDQRTTGMAESQVNFENTTLLDAPIKLPPIDEQRAIASFLSDMDTEITALEKRRDKTRAIKQGMIQQLLTGRVRLVKPEVAA